MKRLTISLRTIPDNQIIPRGIIFDVYTADVQQASAMSQSNIRLNGICVQSRILAVSRTLTGTVVLICNYPHSTP